MGKRLKHPFTIEKLEFVDVILDGRSIGRHEDGRVIFVHEVIPGDVAEVHVYRKEKGSLIGNVVKRTQDSEDRKDPDCAHFLSCGGCKWQHMKYEKQLYYKEKYVRDSLSRIAKVEIGEFHDILGMKDPYWYRNKLEFTFSTQRWLTADEIEKSGDDEIEKGNSLGYNSPKSFYKIVNVEECMLQNTLVNEVRNEIRRYAKANNLSYHDIREHTGFLRNIVFRSSDATGEMMLMLIVGEDDQPAINSLFSHLEGLFKITSFVWILNEKKNSSYADLDFHVWKGSPFITESLGEWKFQVGPTSFFQTNTSQANVLFDVVRKFVGEKCGTIYDLYAGAGSIGIYINDLADKIVGIEYSEAAVKDAAKNLELNKLEHLSFFAGDMKNMLSDEFTSKEGKPDVVVTDPPRAGMDKPVVEQLLKLAPQKIVYVSCNPSTQARDIALLSEKYAVKAVQPVDMFPQTAHVENVALLELK